MSLGFLIFGLLAGVIVATAVWALSDAGILLSLVVLVVTANLVAGLCALWRAGRRK